MGDSWVSGAERTTERRDSSSHGLRERQPTTDAASSACPSSALPTSGKQQPEASELPADARPWLPRPRATTGSPAQSCLRDAASGS